MKHDLIRVSVPISSGSTSRGRSAGSLSEGWVYVLGPSDYAACQSSTCECLKHTNWVEHDSNMYRTWKHLHPLHGWKCCPLLSFCLKEGSIVVKCKIFIVRKALFTPENMTLTFVKHLIKQDSGVQLMGVNSAYEDSAEDGCTFKEGRKKVEQNFCFHTCDFHSLRPHP